MSTSQKHHLHANTKYETQAQLSTVISHDYFTNWTLDMDLETDRMLVLDTPPEEDALYYGTAFISGTAEINGPFDELVVDVVATTEPQTSGWQRFKAWFLKIAPEDQL